MTPAAATQHKEFADKSDRELLQTIAANTSVMAVKLFGSSDADNEQETGRLPKVESSAKAAHARIDDFKDSTDKQFRDVYVRMAYAAGAVAAFLFVIELVFKK